MVPREQVDDDRRLEDWDWFLLRLEELEETIREVRERIIDRRHEDWVSVAEHPGWEQ